MTEQQRPQLKPRLHDVVTEAKALAGDKWDEVKTWPLESGLVFLAGKLKG